MERATPRQAFAAREAHEALIELKNLVEEAARATHAAELESFHVAIAKGESSGVRNSLRTVADRLTSTDFEEKVSQARQKLQMAATA